MGLFTRAVVGRWLARWLMRGSPLAIVAKLAAVGAFGAWRFHRQRKREAGRTPQQIEADYEVLGPDRIAPVAPRSGEPQTDGEGTRVREIDREFPSSG